MKLMLAKSWRDYSHKIDPTGWLMSEKLDGIRGLWTGNEFISRGEKPFFVPEWFKEGLPDFELDGEFYLPYGCFEETCSIVRKHDKGDGWRAIIYLVFDTPIAGSYLERMEKVLNWFDKHQPPYAAIVPQKECRGIENLNMFFEKLVTEGGEGAMLRHPDDEYYHGRTNKLLKLKQLRDGEAVVIEYQEGKGKYIGQTGALIMQMPNGKTFKIGSGLTDVDRKNPPAIGVTITYRYTELTKNGIPRHARFFRVRSD